MADTTSRTQRTSGGIGFLGVFFLVLFTLKVTGPLADVSWWFITAPIWGVPALIVAILLVCLVVWCAAHVMLYLSGGKR